MGSLATIARRKRRNVSIGALDTLIVLHTRVIEEPDFETADFDEKFTNALPVWAKVETVNGKTFFDGAAREDRALTHDICIRKRPEVDDQSWIELPSGARLDIVDIEDFDERGEFLRLRCSDRGNKTHEASKL